MSNENLNLVEILKDCPKGTKLYSPAYGDVELLNVSQDKGTLYPIVIKIPSNSTDTFTCGRSFDKDGRIFADYSGECLLFPSKEQRDWSKFNVKKPKFDPKTLKPFDKVFVRDINSEKWRIQLFSHIIKDCFPYEYHCIGSCYNFCIPYNDDTKHLVGTKDEAPEFYRYWED